MTGVIDIGLYSDGTVGLAIFGMGTMDACFHCLGTTDVHMESDSMSASGTAKKRGSYLQKPSRYLVQSSRGMPQLVHYLKHQNLAVS